MKKALILFTLSFYSLFSFAQGPNIGLQLYGIQQPDDLYTNRIEFRFVNALSVQHHFKPISLYARLGMQQDNDIQTHRNVDSFSSTSQDYIAQASESRYLEIGAQRYVNIKNSDFRALFRIGGYWAKFNAESPKTDLDGYNNFRDYTFLRTNTKGGVTTSLGLEYAIAKNIYVQAETQVMYSVRNSEDVTINPDPDSYPKSGTKNYTKRGISLSPILITIGVNLWNK